MTEQPDYYTILGLSHYATRGQIEQKYEELIAANPPDDEWDQIEAAYAVLSDLHRRQRYDLETSLQRIQANYHSYMTHLPAAQWPVSVIDVGYDTAEIVAALRKALFDAQYRQSLTTVVNPYGDGHTAPKIYKVLKEISLTGIIQKKFYE